MAPPLPAAPANPAGRRSALRLLGVAAGIAVVGAVAGTLEWWGGGSGLAGRDLVEGVLSDVATGAGAALITALLLYVVCWWAVRGVRTVRRPR